VHRAEPAVVAEAAPIAEAPAAPAPLPEAPATRRVAPRAPVAPAEPPNTLIEETNLLRQAEVARASGNVARATALLDEHASRFPNGQMAPERAAERMVIQCQTGKAGAAAGQQFLSEHPGSPYGARVKQTCHIGTP